MPISNFVQASFLSGEWSPYAQGRSDKPEYRAAMNVCRNGFPLEEGAWIRRSGTRFAATTLNGAAGRTIHFDFEQTSPYIMEFTDGFLRFFAVSTQTGGLTTPLPSDFRLVTTNDNQQVASISTANPAVVQTAAAHGWTTGDQGQFLFASTLNAGFTPLLRARTFKITVTDSTHFSIADPISGATIDGSTLGWSAPTAGTVVFVRNVALGTPYTAGSWASIRKVQAETQALLLQGTIPPRNLNVTAVPTASKFASFSLAAAQFLDGPYLDPPLDASILTPNLTAATSGTLPSSQGWNLIATNGNIFLAASTASTVAATSTDGVTWTTRTLPFAPSAMTANGTIFLIVGSGTQAATSPTGAVWTARTLSASGTWNCAAFGAGAALFVVGGTQTSVGPAVLTSPDGIVWTTRGSGNGVIAAGVAVAWNGSVFAMSVSLSGIGGALISSDGITWAVLGAFPNGGGFPPAAGAIAANGTIFCAVVNNSSVAFISTNNGVTWIQETMPSVANWDAIAANGTVFCTVASNWGFDATSPDGVTWTTHAMPTVDNWDGIAWNGTTFVALASGSATDYASTNGVFSTLTLTASSIAQINSGAGFASTDVGRSIRLLSEPLNWFVGTTYAAGAAVKFNDAYFVALQGTNTGNQPDVTPTFWALSTAVARWTWVTILSINAANQVVASVQGLDLLYTTLQINIWRLGVYSGTTGYPTCGTYYEGRIWLSGVVANRVDASVVNEIANGIINMSPTAADGTVADNLGISYIFNSSDVNPIFWMAGMNAGIVCGTQAGEWLISAPTTGPITPTNIQAHRGTTYGSSNVDAEYTQLTLSFVQRYDRTLLEYFPDVFSGRFVAPSLTENAKHLTQPGIAEIKYQQELLPIIWNRLLNGALVAATYERDNLFSSQPAKFIGWHRHDLGSGRTIDSIAVGPSTDGTIDTLAMVTHSATQTVRHVELMQQIFEVNAAITAGWFLDDAVTPSGGVLSGTTLTLYGLWHLNGSTVTVTVGGIDCGDVLVSSGSLSVTLENSSLAYLQTISSTTAYGALTTYIDGTMGRLAVPAVVGFTYTSQGQILRPDAADQQRSQLGPGLSKPRKLGTIGALLRNTQGISFGTDFSKLHAAQFKSAGGSTSLTALQLFSGVYWASLDDTWGFDSMLCWQISRPYPAAVVAIGGSLESTDR